MVPAVGTVAAGFGSGLGSAHHELAAHVLLVVEFGDGALGLVDGVQLDEAEALGAMGLAVADDFDVLDRADSAEEFEQVALGGVEGEVADVDAGSGHLDALGLARLARGGTLRTIAAGRTLGLAGGGLLAAEADQGEELREEALLLGGLLGTTLVIARAAGVGAGATGT